MPPRTCDLVEYLIAAIEDGDPTTVFAALKGLSARVGKPAAVALGWALLEDVRAAEAQRAAQATGEAAVLAA